MTASTPAKRVKKTRDAREVLGIKRRELAAHDEDWPKIKALADRLMAKRLKRAATQERP